MNKQFFFICNGIHITIDRKTCTIKNIKVDEDQKFLYVNRIVFHNNNNHIQELYNIYEKGCSNFVETNKESSKNTKYKNNYNKYKM